MEDDVAISVASTFVSNIKIEFSFQFSLSIILPANTMVLPDDPYTLTISANVACLLSLVQSIARCCMCSDAFTFSSPTKSTVTLFGFKYCFATLLTHGGIVAENNRV
jgi:hypothetical protein